MEKKLIITEINDGYLEPEIKEEDYVYGAGQIPDDILIEDGQWDEFLPSEETQIKNFESYNCTSFNSLSQIEILMKKLYNI